jgi:hypothetical protein
VNDAERHVLFNYLQTTMGKMSSYKELHQFVHRECSVLLPLYAVTPLSREHICPQATDRISLPLYPFDAPDATPVYIKADGNCLPRCGSLLAFGSQEMHQEIRVRIVSELVTNSSLYLDDQYLSRGLQHAAGPLSLLYAGFSGQLPKDFSQTRDGVLAVFQNEILEVTKNSRDMGMWQIHALSTVLNTPIKSVYPIGRGHNVRPHLNRLVLPRDESTAPPAIIMWTSTHGAAAAPHAWIPNHFVVCFPPQ